MTQKSWCKMEAAIWISNIYEICARPGLTKAFPSTKRRKFVVTSGSVNGGSAVLVSTEVSLQLTWLTVDAEHYRLMVIGEKYG